MGARVVGEGRGMEGGSCGLLSATPNFIRGDVGVRSVLLWYHGEVFCGSGPYSWVREERERLYDSGLYPWRERERESVSVCLCL